MIPRPHKPENPTKTVFMIFSVILAYFVTPTELFILENPMVEPTYKLVLPGFDHLQTFDEYMASMQLRAFYRKFSEI